MKQHGHSGRSAACTAQQERLEERQMKALESNRIAVDSDRIRFEKNSSGAKDCQTRWAMKRAHPNLLLLRERRLTQVEFAEAASVKHPHALVLRFTLHLCFRTKLCLMKDHRTQGKYKFSMIFFRGTRKQRFRS